MMPNIYARQTAEPTFCLTLYRRTNCIIETRQFIGTAWNLNDYLAWGWLIARPVAAEATEKAAG